MKNIARTIAIILIFVLSVSTMSSCIYWIDYGINYPKSIFPEGYTGGLGIPPGSDGEYYWVETYEEVVEAVELLRTHNSTFSDENFFVYNGDEFDVKYCFVFGGVYGHNKDKIAYGENPYDRWATNIRVSSYIFLEDVSIDELVYSKLSKYETYVIGFNNDLIDYTEINSTPVSELQIGDWVVDGLHQEVRIFHEQDAYVPAIIVYSCATKSIKVSMTREDIYSILSNGYFENYYNQDEDLK